MSAASQLIKDIQNGCYDETFKKLYGSEQECITAQRERYTKAIEEFESTYGERHEISLYSAPGRTEICGNHTDHNNGIVMAAAVNLDIIAVVSKNIDGVVKVKSKGFPKTDSVDINYLKPVPSEFETSASLIRGVAAGLVDRGGSVGGFDAYTTSDVLSGSGLSSSAAFEVCMGEIFNHEFNDGRFTPVELGIIGQYAENKFFGKPSGLMDQTASAVGGAITTDFKDNSKPVVHEIEFDLSSFGYKLVITDTKGSHADLTDDYAAIRYDMEQVAKQFGKQVLRDVDQEEFYASIPSLRKQCSDRAILRANHFFKECGRVSVIEQAAKNKDIDKFLEVILESGHSSFEYNQNAYSVKNPKEQGVPLALALSQNVLCGKKGAWRLHGGGFAGTIQAFVPEVLLGEYCKTLTDVFGDDACYVLNVRNVGCTKVCASQ